MASTAILARLLTPADFGLIAMVTAVTGFVAMFKDAGLSMATIQREEITQNQVSNLFWLNVALSVGLTILIVTIAPVVAWFYGEPELVWITVGIAGSFVFGGLTVQHQALLRRQMRFKSLAAIDIAAMAGGILTAIVLARNGAEYWALVGLVVATAIINCLLAVGVSRWVPSLPKRKSGTMPLVKFGGNLTAFGFLNYFIRNLDNILIGAMIGPQALGFYTKSYGLLTLPLSQVNAPLTGVMIPTLSRLRLKHAEYKKAVFHASRVVNFIGVPIVVFAFFNASDVVLTLLGEQWSPCIDIFRWLSIAALITPASTIPGWICRSLGMPERHLHWAMVAMPVMACCFLIGVQWGVIGVAIAFSIGWPIMSFAMMFYATWKTHVSVTDIIFPIFIPLVISLLSVGASYGVYALYSLEMPATRLLLSGIVFMCVYLALYLFLPSERMFAKKILSLMMSRRNA